MANEKRLIVLDDALSALNSEGISKNMRAYRKVAALPTVDAAEVVHGRWIVKHNPITDPKRYFIRIVYSKCNLHTGQKSNYCPNCGAKMDSEQKHFSNGDCK